MNFKNSKIQKIISGLLILAIFLPSLVLLTAPKKTDAFLDPVVAAFTKLTSIFTGKTAVESTISTGLQLKEAAQAIAKQVLMVIARRALASMTRSTVNWINNGFHGAPLFVQNPDSFFKDITKTEVKDLITTIGYDQNLFPFGKEFSLNTITAYKDRQLAVNAQYSLSKATNDPVFLNNYRMNFGTGGWDGFLLNTQYPQNNPIGFNILATDNLAIKLQGTGQNAAQKIQTSLEQGQGFLSPQTCPSNPSYNNLQNQFQKPTFNFNPSPEIVAAQPAPGNKNDPLNSTYESADGTIDYNALSLATAQWQKKYDAEKAGDRAEWAETNECKGGLQTTTPGAVVASQITKAIGLPQDQASLGAALGNSLSAIFDTLLNKFIGSPQSPGGLTGIASNTNTPAQTPDTWDYLGNTLGTDTNSVNGTVNDDIFSGPDQVIVLSQFKETVDAAVINTKKEITLIDNDPNSPKGDKQSGYGIMQFQSLLWPKARELDICTPGPDIGFEDRLTDEMDRNSQKLQEKASDEDGDKAYRAGVVIKELKFAVDMFKDWLQTAMIKSGANDLGLPDSIVFLDAVKDVQNMSQLSAQTTGARNSKTSALARLQAIQSALANITIQPTAGSQGEKDLISIRKQYDAAFPFISSPNSIDDTQNELDSIREKYTNITKLIGDCNQERVAKKWTVPSDGNWSNTLDPKSGFVSRYIPSIGKFVVINLFVNPINGDYIDYRGPANGDEIEQFCKVPISGGYAHDSFAQMTDPPQFPELPMVNAGRVYKYSSGFLSLGSTDVHITIQCNAVFRGNILDYKGTLPSLPGLIDLEPKQGAPLPDSGTPGLNPGTNNPIGTCTKNGTTTQTTQINCTSPGVWTSGTNTGGTTQPPDSNCGGAVACG
ncbi:hypothetical protein K2P96_02270 [Patescibacteria group bacterium]|nr:hypothetical protein [Patescibacteria group bacterium]